MLSNIIKTGAAVAALLSAAPAIAADAIEAPYEPPVSNYVDTAPVNIWSGIYGGASLGYTWGKFDLSGDEGQGGNVDAKGISGLGFVGVNGQSGSIVYGVEGDLGYSDAKVSIDGEGGKQGIFGSARARLGYAFDPFMLYGTAGVAATQAKLTATVTNDAGNSFHVSDKNTHLGWTVGVGGEALVTENIFTRVEYRYTDYGAKDYNLDGTAVSSGFSDHSVRAGIGLKF
ncbi:outer membrane protein [Ahrensia sp. 13_GOM-1096m]|uniref:outer membrane protein n=1 Tax=Ahrensia sp. 13_GOM-1096m TaxID=1380380 RepID=UPI00047A1BFD|nr:outer membrane protein [Ahrensia sp. 13_GOM-1096m]